MWKRVHTKTYAHVCREDIWQQWINVNAWTSWHDDLDYCKMEGPFVVGNHFMLKPQKMAPVKIIITDVCEGYSFTDCTLFFGAKMHDKHEMKETKEGIQITNTLTVEGPLKWLWVFLVAKNVAATIENETDALIKLIQKRP